MKNIYQQMNSLTIWNEETQVRENEQKNITRPWQDSNLQSSDPKSDALAIRPQGHD